MPLAAIILAGGRGERLGGVDKASIEIGGRRLLDRVAAVLAPHADPVLVAHGALPADRLALATSWIAVPDLPSGYAGPLAGVAAGIAWLLANRPATELVVTAAVDTPFLPDDYVGRLHDAIGAASPAVIAAHAGQPYPTNGLWRLSAVADLPARIVAGTAPRSLRRLADSLGAIRLDWQADSAEDPFANANTPEDLEKLRRRAALVDGP